MTRTSAATIAILFALAGCASLPRPFAPVANVDYSALGHDPFWLATIGDDSIVLTLGPAGGAADAALDSFEFPRALPSDQAGVRRWQSRQDDQSIVIEARAAACTNDARIYPDQVIVRLGSRTLEGCGGREIGARG